MSEQKNGAATPIEKAWEVIAKYQQHLNTPKVDGAVVIASALMTVVNELMKHNLLLEENNRINRELLDMYKQTHPVEKAILEARLAELERAQDGAA